MVRLPSNDVALVNRIMAEVFKFINRILLVVQKEEYIFLM
jgi:hypothetical protein